MRRWIVFAALGLGTTACSLIFGLEDGKLRPEMEGGADAGGDVQDSGIDTGLPDADAQAIPCDASTTTTAVVADTMLLDVGGNPNPANRMGKGDTMNIAQNGTSRVLVRFTLGPAMLAGLAPDGGVVGGKLTVTIRTSGGACGSSCPNAATAFQVYAANDAWNEGDGGPYSGAEWTNKVGNSSSSQIPWDLPGAKGSTDHSTLLIGTANVTTNQATAGGAIDVALTLDGSSAAEISKWIPNGNLSLLLAPTSGGTLFLYSREGSAGSSVLSVTVCK